MTRQERIDLVAKKNGALDVIAAEDKKKAAYEQQLGGAFTVPAERPRSASSTSSSRQARIDASFESQIKKLQEEAEQARKDRERAIQTEREKNANKTAESRGVIVKPSQAVGPVRGETDTATRYADEIDRLSSEYRDARAAEEKARSEYKSAIKNAPAGRAADKTDYTLSSAVRESKDKAEAAQLALWKTKGKEALKVLPGNVTALLDTVNGKTAYTAQSPIPGGLDKGVAEGNAKAIEAKKQLRELGYSEEKIEELASYRKFVTDEERMNKRLAEAKDFVDGKNPAWYARAVSTVAPLMAGAVTGASAIPSIALGQRDVEKAVGAVTSRPVLATVASVGTQAVSGIAGLSAMAEKRAPGEPVNINDPALYATRVTDALRGAVQDKVDINLKLGGKDLDLFDTGYGILTSSADSLVAAYMGAGVPGLGGSLIGMQAGVSAMVDMAQRGGTANQAIATGVVAGIFECLFEDVSISQFDRLKEVKATSFREFAQNMSKAMVTNGEEEFATELANVAYDTIANGNVSNYAESVRDYMSKGYSEAQAKKLVARDLALQVIGAGVTGALQGVFMGSVAQVDATIGERAEGKEIKKGSAQFSLLSQAMEYEDGSETKKLAQRLSDRVNAAGADASSTAKQRDLTSHEVGALRSLMAEEYSEFGPRKTEEQRYADTLSAQQKDETVLSPTATALQQNGLSVQDAQKKGQILSRVFAGDTATSGSQIDRLDLLNDRVTRAMFEEKTGVAIPSGATKADIRRIVRGTIADVAETQTMRTALETANREQSAAIEAKLQEQSAEAAPKAAAILDSEMRASGETALPDAEAPNIAQPGPQGEATVPNAETAGNVPIGAEIGSEGVTEGIVYPSGRRVTRAEFTEQLRKYAADNGAEPLSDEQIDAVYRQLQKTSRENAEAASPSEETRASVPDDKKAAAPANERQKREQQWTVNYAKAALRKYGVSDVVLDYTNDSDNAKIDLREDGTATITVSGNRMKTQQMIVWALGHELTHDADGRGVRFTNLVLDAFRRMADRGELNLRLTHQMDNLEKLIDRKRRIYFAFLTQKYVDSGMSAEEAKTKAEKTATSDYARQEIAGDLMGAVFSSENVLSKLAQEEPGAIRQALNKVRSMLARRVNGESKTELRRIEDALKTALKNNIQNTRDTGIENRYSVDERKSFADQIHETLNGGLKLSGSGITPSGLYVAKELSALYQEIGFGDYPVVMTQKHAQDINAKRWDSDGNVIDDHHHQIDEKMLASLPDLLTNDVAAIFKADPKSRAVGSVVVVTTQKDVQGNPVIIALKPNGTNTVYDGKLGPAHVVTSMYGRERFDYYLRKVADSKAIIYVNKEKAAKVSAGTDGATVVSKWFADLNPSGFDTILQQRDAAVNGENVGTRRYSTDGEDHLIGDEWTSEERYSLRSTHHDSEHGFEKGGMYYDLIRTGIMTKDEAEQLQKSIDDLIDFMLPDAALIDMNEEYDANNRPFSAYKQNSDPLYKISLDFSTLCKKRITTQYIIERLQLASKRPMSAERQLAIRDMLKEYAEQDKALQVACAMCYVEAARLKAPAQIERFLAHPDAAVRKYFAKRDGDYKKIVAEKQAAKKVALGYKPDTAKKNMRGADATALNEYSAKLRDEYGPNEREKSIIEESKTLPKESFLSADNLTKLSVDHPEIYSAYVEFIRSATHSKPLESGVPYYYGDSKSVTDGFIESVNAENGMRHQSWSDFQIEHLLDTLVAVVDLSVRGSKMHAYTKVPMFVRCFGNTGIMINLSLVPAGKTGLKNGSLDFSPVEGMDILETEKLRDEFPETAGTIAIACNDDQLRMLLADPRIDYVIPYHTSGMNAALRTMAGINGWTDYQSRQHAEIIDKKAENSAVEKWHVEPVFSEFYAADLADGKHTGAEIMKESAKRYIAMCEERGMRPKFNDFSGEANYWKLLIDRKMVNQKTGGIIVQQVVKPNFDFAEIKRQISAEVKNLSGLREAEDAAFEKIKTALESGEVDRRAEQLKKSGAVKEQIKKATETRKKIQVSETAQRAAQTLGNTVIAAGSRHSIAEDENENISSYTESRIDGIIREYGASDPKYAQGYVTSIDPRDFLKLTISDDTLGKWSAAKQRGDDPELFPLDESKLRSESQAPHLTVDSSSGEIIGHEGRHRMLALMERGIKSTPVVILDMGTKYTKVPTPSMKLSAQDYGRGPVNGGYSVTVSDLIPTNKKYREEILARYGKRGDIRYAVDDAEYLTLAEEPEKNEAHLSKMVKDAAKNAGAITENEKPLVLYHGTGRFGFTTFNGEYLFATDDQSIAAGYTANKGWGRSRKISEKYVPSNSVSGLIKNARNILETDLHVITEQEQKTVRADFIAASEKLSKKVESAWTTDAVDVLGTLPGFTEYFNNALGWVLTLPGSINEYLKDEVASDAQAQIRSNVEMFNKYKEDLRDYLVSHHSEIKGTPAAGIYELVTGFDLTDFAVDAQYQLLASFDPSALVSSVPDHDAVSKSIGGISSQEDTQKRILALKDVGAYRLYGMAGEKPLVIDGKQAMWTNIHVPEFGEGTFSTDDIAKRAKTEGYTSVQIKDIYDMSMNNYAVNKRSNIYIFFDPNQLKSADPVTYDNSGKVIPLAERFSPKKGDIRYSFVSPTEEERNVYLDVLFEELNARGWGQKTLTSAEAKEISEAVRKKTGMFIGYDGLARTEIDDGQIGYDEDGKLSEWAAENRDRVERYNKESAELSRQIEPLAKKIHGWDTPGQLVSNFVQLYHLVSNGKDIGEIKTKIAFDRGERLKRAGMKEGPEYFDAVQDAYDTVQSYADAYDDLRRLKAETRLVPKRPTTLGEILDHPKLYARYPELKNITVKFSGSLRAYAQYDPKNKTITLNNTSVMTLLHEVQHAVQNIAGFTQGTNPKFAGGMSKYTRNAGEIEARDVEGRLGLSAEDRLKTRPDIDRADALDDRGRPYGTRYSAEEDDPDFEKLMQKFDADYGSGSFKEAVKTSEQLRRYEARRAKDEADTLTRKLESAKAKYEYWRGQAQRTTQKTVDVAAVDRVARGMLKKYGSTADTTKLRKDLRELYNDMLADRDAQEVFDKALRIADDVAGNAQETLESMFADEAELRKYLRSARIRLTAAEKKSLGEDYNLLRKRNMGRFTIADGGTHIDQIYQELAEKWPGTFDASKEITTEDQFRRIAEVAEKLYTPVVGNTMQSADAKNYVLADVLDSFSEIPEAEPTFADRMWEKLETQRWLDRMDKEVALEQAKRQKQQALERQKATSDDQARVEGRRRDFLAALAEADAKAEKQDALAEQKARMERQRGAAEEKLKAEAAARLSRELRKRDFQQAESEQALKMHEGKKTAQERRKGKQKVGDLKQKAADAIRQRTEAATRARRALRHHRGITQLDTINDVVDTMRDLPGSKTAQERISETSRFLRTVGRSAYRTFVNDVQEIDNFSRSQSDGILAGTLVNISRGADSTTEYISTKALVNRSGEVIGPSMRDTILCIKKNGKVDNLKQAQLQDYMLHRHNIDRMGIEQKARDAVAAFEAANPWLLQIDRKEFAQYVMTGPAERQAICLRYQMLMEREAQARNKAIFADEKGKPVSAETSRMIVAKYESELDWVKEKAEDIYAWWDSFMQEWAVGTSISQEQYDAMKEIYPSYVPTYRKQDSIGSPLHVSNGTAGIGQAVKKAVGSVRAVANFEDSYSKLMGKIVKLNRNNELFRNIIDTAMLDEDGEVSNYAVFDWESEAVHRLMGLTADEIADRSASLSLEKVNGENGEEYKVNGWVDGRRISAYISKSMYDALQSLAGPSKWAAVTKVGRVLTGPMKTMITGLNPIFATRNVPRDFSTACINSISGMAFGKYYAQSLVEIRKKSDNWIHFQALGGTNMSYYNNENGYAKAIAKGQNIISKGTEKLGAFNELTEVATRFAEYLATIDRMPGGDTYANRLLGIKNAAEVTVDFSRHGTIGRALNAWIPYWNPRVQGFDKMLRSVVGDKSKVSAIAKQAGVTLTRGLLATALPEALLMAIIKLLGRYDDWEKLSDRTKDTYFCIPMAKEHRFLKIAKNRDWGVVLGVPLLRILQSADGRSDPFRNYVEQSLLPMLPELDPINMAKSAIIVGQIVDLTSGNGGKDFTGRDIIPYAYQKASKAEQWDANTSVFARGLSELIENRLSPMQIDYLISDYCGDFVNMIVKLVGTSGLYDGGTTLGEIGVTELANLQKSFVADSRYSNQAVSDYYDLLDKLDTEIADADVRGEDKTQTTAYKAKQALEAKNGLGTQISKLNLAVKTVAAGQEKDDAKQQIATLAEQALSFYESIKNGDITEPKVWASNDQFGSTIRDEMVRMTGYADDYSFEASSYTPSKYSDPANKSNEYVFTEDQKAKYHELYAANYQRYMEKLILSPAYKKATDEKKAEMLEACRTDEVLENTKAEFMDWIRESGVKSTPKK